MALVGAAENNKKERRKDVGREQGGGEGKDSSTI